jgi:hypothetical protein
MAIFLNCPLPDWGATIKPSWQNTPIADDMGKVIQVRGVGRTTPIWNVTISYNRALSDQVDAFNMSVFQSAIRSLRGGAVSCYFYTPSFWDWWDDAAAGVGDGTVLEFPFGGCDLAADWVVPVVKLDGVARQQYDVGVTDPIWTVATLADDTYNRWAVTFAAGYVPAAGVVVSVCFMGRRLLLGGLSADPGEMAVNRYAGTAFSIQLQGEEV